MPRWSVSVVLAYLGGPVEPLECFLEASTSENFSLSGHGQENQ